MTGPLNIVREFPRRIKHDLFINVDSRIGDASSMLTVTLSHTTGHKQASVCNIKLWRTSSWASLGSEIVVEQTMNAELLSEQHCVPGT